MIDLLNEKLLSLEEARHHPLAKNGKGIAPSLCSFRRWATQGIRGVKLEHIEKPCGIFTTELALVRFIEKLSMPKEARGCETPSQRRKEIAHAKAILKSFGI